MTTYSIIISEDQRVALRALFAANPCADSAGSPLEYWPEMLDCLPSSEAESPDTLHGFCL